MSRNRSSELVAHAMRVGKLRRHLPCLYDLSATLRDLGMDDVAELAEDLYGILRQRFAGLEARLRDTIRDMIAREVVDSLLECLEQGHPGCLDDLKALTRGTPR